MSTTKRNFSRPGWILTVVFAVAMVVSTSNRAPAANDSPTAKALQALVETSLTAYDSENGAAFLDTIHTKSPEYGRTKDVLAGQFTRDDATVTLDDFDYMGHDDEFAVARVKIKTTSDAPDFTDNVVDTLSVFKQEDGKWKYWSDALLGVSIVQK